MARWALSDTVAVMRRLATAALLLVLSCSMVAGVPPSDGAPKVGSTAPAFTLPDADGTQRSLASLLAAADGGKPGSVLLIFYRGHW